MRALALIGILCLLAVPALADDIDRPLSSGVTQVRIQATGDTSVGLTRSVGLRREDTGALVFCAPATTGEIVEGESDAIVNLGAAVLLSAFAFDAPDCTGLESLPSIDRYRVVFGAPGRPALLPVSAAGPEG